MLESVIVNATALPGPLASGEIAAAPAVPAAGAAFEVEEETASALVVEDEEEPLAAGSIEGAASDDALTACVVCEGCAAAVPKPLLS